MENVRKIKDNLYQIFAITERDVRLAFRFKIGVIFSFITPVIGIIMPLILFGKLLEFNDTFGPWDETNYFIYLLLAYNLGMINGIRHDFSQGLGREKTWQTIYQFFIRNAKNQQDIIHFLCSEYTRKVNPEATARVDEMKGLFDMIAMLGEQMAHGSVEVNDSHLFNTTERLQRMVRRIKKSTAYEKSKQISLRNQLRIQEVSKKTKK